MRCGIPCCSYETRPARASVFVIANRGFRQVRSANKLCNASVSANRIAVNLIRDQETSRPGIDLDILYTDIVKQAAL